MEQRELRIGANGGKVNEFKKDANGRTLIVIAEIRHRECWILTGYYEN
jgi:uncharacterized protein YjhX (UPF0386 family)